MIHKLEFTGDEILELLAAIKDVLLSDVNMPDEYKQTLEVAKNKLKVALMEEA